MLTGINVNKSIDTLIHEDSDKITDLKILVTELNSYLYLHKKFCLLKVDKLDLILDFNQTLTLFYYKKLNLITFLKL